MLKEKLFGATEIPLLKLGLDAYALRHKAISDNLANAETIGYKRKEVRFEDKLQELARSGLLERTTERHLGTYVLGSEQLTPELMIDTTPSDVNDINNVDIDNEMSEMAKNHLQFNYASHLSKMFFELLNTSIRGV